MKVGGKVKQQKMVLGEKVWLTGKETNFYREKMNVDFREGTTRRGDFENTEKKGEGNGSEVGSWGKGGEQNRIGKGIHFEAMKKREIHRGEPIIFRSP